MQLKTLTQVFLSAVKKMWMLKRYEIRTLANKTKFLSEIENLPLIETLRKDKGYEQMIR